LADFFTQGDRTNSLDNGPRASNIDIRTLSGVRKAMSKIYVASLFLAFSIITPVQGNCATQTPNAIVTDVTSSSELAALLVSVESMKESADKVMLLSFEEFNKNDAAFKAVTVRYPGLENALADALRPIIYEEMARIIAPYRADIAALYLQNFTPSEMKALIAFWGSMRGRSILTTINSKADFSQMTKELIAQPVNKMAVSNKTLSNDIRNTARKGVAALSEGDMAALSRFSLSPLGLKFAKIQTEKQAIDLKWANTPLSPEADARVAKDIPAAIEAFIIAAEGAKAQEKVNP
jgi:hypothetical protein